MSARDRNQRSASSAFRRTLAHWAARGLSATRVPQAVFQRRHGLRILCYHGVYADDMPPAGLPAYFVSRSLLAEHLAAVRRLGPIVPLHEAIAELRHGRAAAQSMSALTFDDVPACVVQNALPVLAAFGVRATFFIATGHAASGRLFSADVLRLLRMRGAAALPAAVRTRPLLEDPQRHKRMPIGQVRAAIAELEGAAPVDVPEALREALRPANWTEIRAIADAGHEIGAHTIDHAFLGFEADAERRRQVVGSIDDVEQNTGTRPIGFAFPNGGPDDFGACDVAVLREIGAGYAVTTRPGFASCDALHALPRTVVGAAHSADKLILEMSGVFDRYRQRRQGWP